MLKQASTGSGSAKSAMSPTTAVSGRPCFFRRLLQNATACGFVSLPATEYPALASLNSSRPVPQAGSNRVFTSSGRYLWNTSRRKSYSAFQSLPKTRS